MDLPEGFDLDALLTPIPGDAPAGVDLREDFSPKSPYYRLRDARAEARAAERTADAAEPDQAGGGNQEAAMPPQWRSVRDVAIKVLTENSKDLEVAAWLTEALVRNDGLSGLAAGAKLIGGLTEAFWDSNLYPLPDEDGIATRVAPVAGLNGVGGDGTLTQPLRKVALWQRPDGSNFGFWQYEQSVELAAITDPARLQARLQAGVLPFEDMEREARSAGPTRWAALREETAETLQAWQAMSDVLDARAGADSPPTSRIRDLLQQMRDVAAKYAPGGGEPAPSATSGAAASATAGRLSGSGAAAGTDGGATRDDMLRELARISEFFRRTEPHSPLAYTLEEAVRRGRMNWPELLEEIVPDPSVRSAIQTALGIKPADAG
jgi:type VI secretion system protein ImpA